MTWFKEVRPIFYSHPLIWYNPPQLKFHIESNTCKLLKKLGQTHLCYSTQCPFKAAGLLRILELWWFLLDEYITVKVVCKLFSPTDYSNHWNTKYISLALFVFLMCLSPFLSLNVWQNWFYQSGGLKKGPSSVPLASTKALLGTTNSQPPPLQSPHAFELSLSSFCLSLSLKSHIFLFLISFTIPSFMPNWDMGFQQNILLFTYKPNSLAFSLC